VSDICPMSAVPIVFIVDEDVSVRESLELLIQGAGCRAETFASAEEFLSRPRVHTPSCLILDVMLPDLNGLDLQERIAADRVDMPIIFVTGAHDISTTVRAMKAGAAEFLTKPCDYDVLLSAIRHAVDRSRRILREEAEMGEHRTRYASLTAREREVMDLVVIGELNKQIGGELGISEITVKAHRSNMMRKMKAGSLVDLVNMAARLRPSSVPNCLTLDGPAVLEGHRGGCMTSQLFQPGYPMNRASTSSHGPKAWSNGRAAATVFIVDGDDTVRDSLESLIQSAGWQPEIFACRQEFLSRERVLAPSCLILDVALPDLNGLDLQQLVADRVEMPTIFITACADVPTTVRAMKAGALEFLTKPFRNEVLLSSIGNAIERSQAALRQEAEMQPLRERYASLSRREREVMRLVVAGRLNKEIGVELGICEITVQAHRGKMMRKMKADSLAGLVNIAARLRLTAAPKV